MEFLVFDLQRRRREIGEAEEVEGDVCLCIYGWTFWYK